ncbi:MAG: Succinate dehydrogenase hydrophobic membrane anchor protein [uncultured Sphingomonas sp.]|uniref:Succinate dehydrogenase hydrophobic membrane anchor subunit n=1 Tax=uncultured Sphingomonas sp. TaxID=158754 RepID=A0A6J4SWA4_9SPHN|nr:succinate dehydrogenase, hydrophobic membrane anchor protein [uncultured Sphingomonas sp.]CAA9507290.1 MAG: Succinate dehydrogenase hydrophobic membrane anchor protein [uncultured Sphingomonas sp.]
MTGPKQIGAQDRNAVPNGKTALGKVRGLGSARHGGQLWIRERVSSAALLLLGTWFIVSLLLLPDLRQGTVLEWLASPLAFVPMALFVYLNFEHSLEGLKVIVDDYQGDEGGRLTWHLVSLFLHVGAGALALYALVRIVFGAAS